MIRFLLLSDLHQEFKNSAWWPKRQQVHAVLLAGDIHNHPDCVRKWILELRNRWDYAVPVIHVRGNHEYYGQGDLLGDTIPYSTMGFRFEDIHSLDRQSLQIGDVLILGTTLWTSLGAQFQRGRWIPNASKLLIAEQGMSDYNEIKYGGRDLDAGMILEEFVRDTAWLEAELALHAGEKILVMTHHAPSFMSLSPSFAADPLNHCYASHLEGLMNTYKPKLWVHGHTHFSSDYQIGNTRIVCNPRGYHPDSINVRFKPDLILEI
jgi:predicted phosphodiesterase